MPLPSALQAVSFDGDGTLWDFEKVMRRSLGCALAELRRAVPGRADSLTVDAMIAIRNTVGDALRARRLPLEAVRLEAFRATIRHVGIHDDDLAAHLNRVYLKHRFEDIELFDDVLPALNALKHRFVLGLISNGNTYPERCGLGGLFGFVLFAQDQGAEKPDPGMFRTALRQTGCRPEQLLHVGDSLEQDVRGAQQAGARSVWLNREGAVNETDAEPDFEVSSLTELVTLCRQLG